MWDPDLMKIPSRLLISPLLMASSAFHLPAQVPMDKIPAEFQAAVLEITKKPDFKFDTRTPPLQVRFSTMEKLFNHPRLAAAMWRYCQFSPTFFAFEEPGGKLYIDDAKGLHGKLTLVYHQPGTRVYLVDGLVEKGRMHNPFPVGAKMVTIYRYWEGPKGFESHLQTWTVLDSALLGIVSRPFRGFIQHRQQEFIAYINLCIATGGTFAEMSPEEFRDPVRREGDGIAVRQFEEVFGRPEALISHKSSSAAGHRH
jgi:hypothetical protein